MDSDQLKKGKEIASNAFWKMSVEFHMLQFGGGIQILSFSCMPLCYLLNRVWKSGAILSDTWLWGQRRSSSQQTPSMPIPPAEKADVFNWGFIHLSCHKEADAESFLTALIAIMTHIKELMCLSELFFLFSFFLLLRTEWAGNYAEIGIWLSELWPCFNVGF